MTRVFALGAAPLPVEPGQRQYAANLRTWHFVQPLLEAGHEVRLVGCRVPEAYADDVPPRQETRDGRLSYCSIDPALFHDRGVIQEIFDEFEADAVLGINTYPASRAVQIETDRPIWCDLNGWIMAEAQAKAFVYDDDAYLSHFWKMERSIIERADVFSTVSRAQAAATIGELATVGRLGRKTFGYRFTHAIPNAITSVDYEHTHTVCRGSVVPEDAFVVLWVGGYNTWTDVDLLERGLTAAMETVPELHFVSTGGALAGHDDITFRRFQDAVARSPHADRFHFAGWVPTADVPCYYFESDVGINIDSENYETLFGARNRINDFLKAGLPVMTTLGTEVSRELAERDLALTFPIGDAEIFAERLRWAARSREALREMAVRAGEHARNEYSYAATTKPLVEWMREPARAPDQGEPVEFADIDFFRSNPYEPDPVDEPVPTESAPTEPVPSEPASPETREPVAARADSEPGSLGAGPRETGPHQAHSQPTRSSGLWRLIDVRRGMRRVRESLGL